MLESDRLEVEALAKQMEVSQRTVFREISSINRALKDKQIKISVKNAALVLAAGGEEQKETLRQMLGNVPKRLLLTPKQRILFITAQLLLADEPYKSTFFSFQLNVAEATVSLYMDSIEQWLKGKNLTLSRKRRYGIRIEGSEWNRRNALVTLIYEYKPVEELLPYIYETKKDPVLHSFFRLLFGDRILKISKEVMALIPEESNDDVPYLTLLFHTMISIQKIVAGHPISLPDEFIREAVSANSFHFDEKLKQLLLEREIPAVESEIAYISIHLPSGCLYDTDQKFRDLDVTVSKLAEEVLYEVRKGLGIDLAEDSQVIAGLSHYFNLAIYRINMGIQVKNSLLDQVREHYGTLFQTVEIACKLVFSKYNIRLSQDEIGFITMNIGAALEAKEDRNKSVSVLIICPNGLFASRILLNKVQSVVRNIERIDLASLKDWSESNCEQYDLILSTVELDAKTGRENMLVVSPFLSDDDIARINSRVAMIRKRASGGIRKRAPAVRTIPAKADDLAMIHRMIEGLCVQTVPAEPFEAVVGRITAELAERGTVADWHEISALILKREKIGSVVIPGTRVSLLHIRSDSVFSPFVGVYRLQGEIMMDGVGFVQEPVDTYLLMLARSSESSVVLEKMGDISISLIENKDFPERLRKSSLGELRKIFENLLLETKEERG
ncbi:BglG family transcription antiterminator [Caproicibacter fermentans]